MFRYILRRLVQAVPTLFGITALSYLLMGLSGNPVAALTFDPTVTPQARARLAEALGVNDALPVQYLRWLVGDDWMRRDTDGDGQADTAIFVRLYDGEGNLLPPGTRQGVLRGDWGNSFVQRSRGAMQVLLSRMPATVELAALALTVGVVLGVPIGIMAAVWRGKAFDQSARVGAVMVDAIPNFWLGLLLIIFVALRWRWLPSSGRADAVAIAFGDYPPIWERWEYLVLPVLVLCTGAVAGYSRYTRASMLDVINQDYVRTGFAKGLSNGRVWFWHAARNALIPIATFLGPALAGLIGGAAITETVFAWPGVGRSVVQAVVQRDYPVVMAAVVLGSIATILGYLTSDILYALIDPRIRYD